ncbi:hypothetical protein ONZ45_g10606 [Pleurotus djamor]|nr:hypothetical protein ONZ45_g10606 [Pleurotus djamor]
MGYYYDDDEWRVIKELICSLPRLRRLSVPHQPPPIPQTICLTHLVIRSDCTVETYKLISLQPNLRYLRLGRISSDTVLEHLPKVHIPQLNVLDCSVHFLNKLDGSPPIEDLTLSITPNDRRGNVQIIPIHIIRRIRSLKCSLHVLEKLVSYCDGLEYLWTIRTHTFKPILSISSSALRYICLEYRHLNFSYDPSIFDRFPALAIIDFGGAMSDYPRVRRLIRGAPVISWMTEGEVNGPPFHQDGFPVWRGLAEGGVKIDDQRNVDSGLPAGQDRTFGKSGEEGRFSQLGYSDMFSKASYNGRGLRKWILIPNRRHVLFLPFFFPVGAMVPQMLRKSHHIPPEIVRLIVDEVGTDTPYRNSLLPILRVSRSFYNSAIPLLYESISTMAVTKFSFPTSHAHPRTYIFPQHGSFMRLHEALTLKPRLATYIKTFISHGKEYSTAHEWDSIQKILPLLSCLLRLYLIPPAILVPTVQNVHKSIQLTHFTFLAGWNETVYNFIRSQPSLEYLAIAGVSPETKLLAYGFPAISLPKLKILDCRLCFFSKLDTLAPLEHLSIAPARGVHLYNSSNTPLELLRTVKSLLCPLPMLTAFSPFCDAVEFLWITDPISTDKILELSPKTVQYLRFPDHNISSSGRQKLFGGIPALLMIDILSIEGTIRYMRGSNQPTSGVGRIGGDIFSNWHESLLDGIEKARGGTEDSV